MLPFPQKIAFALFALLTLALGTQGFYRLYLRIRRGQPDGEQRFNQLIRRFWYAVVTTLTQQRTFKKRPTIGVFHSFIFYGFIFYGLVNLVDAVEGFFSLSISSQTLFGAVYNALADGFSFIVLLGVVALVIRRFALPSRRDFKFNERTVLHKDVQLAKISRDSVIVSAFILFHVGSRAIGAGARVAAEGHDRLQPFATALSHLFTPANAEAWRIFGYWGALGSVLAFLVYFPYSKHVHIFMAPVKYLVEREAGSGVLPAVALDLESDDQRVGASRMEDLGWPRLLDAYACIQCNRCQDVCPATATGKSLSPAALEINKRMELNDLASERSPFAFASAPFETGSASPAAFVAVRTLAGGGLGVHDLRGLHEVCPVQDEQMLDIIDIRRNQVMIEGEFPVQLQSAFRGMERAQNPWGINHEQRLGWADGLDVRTTAENPTPDVLYWVGCAASYDPQAQKTARAFVELLNHAEVNFAVLGKRECCTGDSARRAGNEYLYRQLADKNVVTLNAVKPKLIVASCPHCMNSIGSEYKQIGGDYKVIHHTEYLEMLVGQKKLVSSPAEATITYHDPCYLGRHNGVYDAPRNLLRILGNEMVELGRQGKILFAAGPGAQFWKEEEEGDERISDNRFREVEETLESAAGEKVLAVGCPFCKSMLGSTPRKGESEIVIKDVAELLLEGVRRKKGLVVPASPQTVESGSVAVAEPPIGVVAISAPVSSEEVVASAPVASEPLPVVLSAPAAPIERKKWQPRAAVSAGDTQAVRAEGRPVESVADTAVASASRTERKKWQPKVGESKAPEPVMEASNLPTASAEPVPVVGPTAGQPERKKWQPKTAASETPVVSETGAVEAAPVDEGAAGAVAGSESVSAVPDSPLISGGAATGRKKWQPKKGGPATS